MAKLKPMLNEAGDTIGYTFNCPGCKSWHCVHVTEKNSCGAQWSFDGNMEQPTFSPSLVQRVGPWPENATRDGKPIERGHIDVCHLFVRGGICEFLSDCTHDMAGKSAPIVDS